MIIKDPWGRVHRVNDQYDNQELENITPPSGVTFEVSPEDLLTRSNYNWNSASTREDANKSVDLTDVQKTQIVDKTKENW